MSTQKNTDPEAWLADQLAQLPTLPDVSVMVRDGWGMTPESVEFAAVQKLAQEYGEMCAARATEPFVDRKEFLVAGDPVEVRIDGSPAADADRWVGEVAVDDGTLIVRPKEDS